MNKTTEALKLAEAYIAGMKWSEEADEALAAIREVLAKPEITTPDVCGEVCARAKLCYGCGKAFDEANAKLADHSGDANEMVYSKPSVFDGVCCGCSKKAADGWALYCVECWEKAEPVKQEKRAPRRGDIVECIETGEKCLVWSGLGDNGCIIEFDDKTSGTYTVEQFNELFLFEPDEPVKQEPVAEVDTDSFGCINWLKTCPDNGTKLYAAPVDAKAIGLAIHYPDCWDTAAYPTLDSALAEIAAWGNPFRCTNDDCVDAKAIRAEALEEAAKVCDKAAKHYITNNKEQEQVWLLAATSDCAAAIRGMK